MTWFNFVDILWIIEGWTIFVYWFHKFFFFATNDPYSLRERTLFYKHYNKLHCVNKACIRNHSVVFTHHATYTYDSWSDKFDAALFLSIFSNFVTLFVLFKFPLNPFRIKKFCKINMISVYHVINFPWIDRLLIWQTIHTLTVKLFLKSKDRENFALFFNKLMMYQQLPSYTQVNH